MYITKILLEINEVNKYPFRLLTKILVLKTLISVFPIHLRSAPNISSENKEKAYIAAGHKIIYRRANWRHLCPQKEDITMKELRKLRLLPQRPSDVSQNQKLRLALLII